MKLAVVGATGLVGREMIKVLEEFGMKVDEFIPVASSKSAGKNISFHGKDYVVIEPGQAVKMRPDVAIFSAGAQASREWAPQFAKVGTFVIDNSSAWRKDQNIPLVVPEINSHSLNKECKIIANPNCSTIQMVMVLSPLHKKYVIRRIVVSTYQGVTGSGLKAVRQLEGERQGIEAEKAFPHTIDLNVIPHAGTFNDDGYTTEEEKLSFETRKILGDQSIRVTATAVRVPVLGGHSEAVNVEFEKSYDLKDVRTILATEKGIIVQDDYLNALYPMPISAKGRNEVFVGRIRRDTTISNGLNLWIVSDNLRKGAATNAVQIVLKLVEGKFVN